MNKQRRNRLEKVFDMLSEAQEIIEEIKREEREAYDNLPDSFRNGERGEEMEGYIEMLEETYNYIDDAKSVVEQI